MRYLEYKMILKLSKAIQNNLGLVKLAVVKRVNLAMLVKLVGLVNLAMLVKLIKLTEQALQQGQNKQALFQRL